MTDVLTVLSSGGKQTTGTVLEFTCGSGTNTLTIPAGTSTLTAGMQVSGAVQIPANTFIESIHSSSQIIISNDTVAPAIGGITAKFTSANYDVPTNPHINLVKTLTSTDRIFTGIFSDDTNTDIIFNEVGTSTSNTERENLATTEGYRIKCYNSVENVGVQLIDSTNNYSAAAFSQHHYFVLLHSDNSSLHHFARVTEVLKGDEDGDFFEFEPRLGTEIPKGTKFMLFKGPLKTTNPIALSAGIKSDLQFELFCSRPLFYFFDDKVDKKNELNHGTKYFAYCQTASVNNAVRLSFTDATCDTNHTSGLSDGSSTSVRHITHTANSNIVAGLSVKGNGIPDGATIATINNSTCFTLSADTTATNNNTTLTFTPVTKTTFLTVTEYSEDIVDYSKYNLRATVVDNLRTLDAPQTNTSNEGNSVSSLDFTDYSDVFPNARRDTDSDHTSPEFEGPRRYLHYKYSPDKSNQVFGVFDNIIYESYGNRGGYAETKIADMFRIQNKKVAENEPYRIRHTVHRADLEDWFELDVEVLTDSSPTYTFTTDFDLNNFLNADDEVRLGDKVFIIETIGTFIAATGNVPANQNITFRKVGSNKYHKTDGVSGVFVTSSNPTISVGSKLFRRAFNRQDFTLMTDFPLVNNRFNNLFIKFISKQYGFLRASVTSVDPKKKMIDLSFTNKTYGTTDNSALSWLEGEYEIEIEKFNGTIETVDSYQENGQRILDISGRNKFAKLLSPVINDNTLHSQDIIYSSNSPFNNITLNTNSPFVVCSFDTNFVDYKDPSDASGGTSMAHGFHATNDIGTDIYLYNQIHKNVVYIGRIATVNSTTRVTLESKSLAENNSNDVTNDKGAFSSNKHYVFNKALSANSFQNTLTDLTATSNRGLIFESGQSITLAGAESSTLVGTSASDDSRALGYFISDVSKVKNDSAFQARLDDNASTKTYQDFDTINTLIDFSILSIKNSDSQTLIEIAPHIPLTLGRVDINFANTQDTTFTDLGACTTGTSGTTFFTIDKDAGGGTVTSDELLSTTGAARKMHNKPIYANNVFIGKVIMVTLDTDHDTIFVYLDRKLSSTISGQTINILAEEFGGSFYETKKLTHELSLLNGGHLHTGKIISLLSPHTNSHTLNKAVSMNYPLYYNTMDKEFTYAEKYGSPYYRIMNLEKGNYNRITSTPTTDIKDVSEYYLEIPSKVSYYASSYKIHAQRGVDGTTGVGKTGFATDSHLLPESRGFTSVYGSRFFDSDLHESGGSAQRVLFTHDPTITNTVADVAGTHENVFTAKDHLDLVDYKIARMFLFANSDLLPYSSKRYDSLMYDGQTRDISNYNFFALESPVETSSSDTKEGSIGKTNTLTLNDANYSSASIISADKTLSSLKRFSIMRLTEVVFDWAFNQIDPENIISKERVLPKFKYSAFKFDSLATLFASTNEVSTSDYQNYQITGCSYNNGTTITHPTNTSVRVGMPVQGSGIPLGATITSITDSTHFVISATTTGGSLSNQTLTFGSFIATDTTVNPNTLTGEREIIADSNGRYIGEVASTEFSSPNGKIILMDTARKTNGTNYFAGTLFSLTSMRNADGTPTTMVTEIKGHGKEDTFVILNEEVHMMKSMVANDIGRYPTGSDLHYGTHPTIFEFGGLYYVDSSWWRKHGEMLDFVGADSTVEAHKTPNIYLPINIGGDSVLGSSIDYSANLISDHPSKLFDILHGSVEQIDNSAPTGNECLYNAHLPIFLDRFDIEDGGGSLVSKGTVGGAVTGLMRRDLVKAKEVSIIGLGLLNDFAAYKDGGNEGSTASGGGSSFSTTIDRSYDDDADGVMMGFKPRLYLDSSSLASGSGTNKAAGDRNVYNYVIDLDTDVTSITYFDGEAGGNSENFPNINRKSLRLMNDLTGCYLVSEKGKFYDADFSVQTYSSLLANTPSLNEQTPNIIAYVISHEIDTTNSTERHILTVDRNLVTDFYRIMQPNHTCFYDFSPKKIRMNSLSSAYTKISGEDMCYNPTEINSFMVRNKSGGRSFTRFHNTGGREAALSMYVPIDIDGETDSHYIVQRKADKMESLLTPNSDLTMVVSDGERAYKTSMTYTDNGDDIGHFLTFDKMEETLGVVSISEPITLTVNGNVSSDAKRGMIGTVANICYEGDELINDLLEGNDIEFTDETGSFPYFLAPNYKGVDLFSAINLVLSKKEKTILEQPTASTLYDRKEPTFSIVNETSDSNHPKVLLSDGGDHQIFEYKQTKNLFDFYNEIIVYGNVHKGTRKDLRSIQKIGRKTLEVHEKDLTSQEAVNERAGDLLRVHSGDNIRLNITVGHTNISQLRAGDVVQVELPREGIELDDYLVLQIQHDFLGMLHLELGKYSKQLEDRFAELLADNKRISSDLRAKEFDERSISFDILDGLEVKVTKLLARKVSSSGGATLGFGSALNISTTPMGFTGGASNTITNLVEEEF